MLQRALINFMLDVHVRDQGYTEVHTPYVVREQIMYGSGQLPKFYDNLYHDEDEDLWLIPTSEVPLVNLYYDQIIPPGSLPLKMTAQSPMFSQGARGSGPRRARLQTRQAVLQSRDGAGGRARGLDAAPGGAGRGRGSHPAAAGAAVSGDAAVYRRPRLRDDQDLRPERLVGGHAGVAGSFVHFECQRLPGAPRQHPLPTRGGRQDRLSAHAERLGRGAAAHADRDSGEQPAARRLGDRSRGAAPLHGRPRADQLRR